MHFQNFVKTCSSVYGSDAYSSTGNKGIDATTFTGILARMEDAEIEPIFITGI